MQVEPLGPQPSFRASMASRAFDSLGEKRPEFPLQFSFLTSAFLIVALMFWQSWALGPARWQWAAPSSRGDSRHPRLMYLHLRGVSELMFFGKKQKLSRMQRTSWFPPPGSNRRVSAFFSVQLGMYTMGTWCLNPVYMPSPGALVVPVASALHPLQTWDHRPPTPPTTPPPPVLQAVLVVPPCQARAERAPHAGPPAQGAEEDLGVYVLDVSEPQVTL